MAAQGIGKGNASIILFGEYFSFFGAQAIGTGIDKTVEVKCDKLKDTENVIIDDKVHDEKVSLKENPEHIMSKIVKAELEGEQFLKLSGFKITINSSVKPKQGLGYSAAFCVALARAINQLQDMDWKEEKIIEVAKKGEQVTNKETTLSVTCAESGTTTIYEKKENSSEQLQAKTGSSESKEELPQKEYSKPIKCGKPLYIVIAQTGEKDSGTKEKTMKWIKENQKEFDKLLSEYKKISVKAKKEIQYNGVQEIGKLLNQNQEILRKTGASNPKIEEIIKLSTYENAIGAKLTGEKGNNVLILCENEKSQDKIILKLQTRNYATIKAKIS